MLLLEKNSPDLPTLYDMLETKLRALENLGGTTEKFADFLEPLMESCLQESTLRACERSRISGVADDSTSQKSLEKLMSFLRLEVESEEMINLAREGFVKNSRLFKGNKGCVLDTSHTATTAMFVSINSSYGGTSTEDPQILENVRVNKIELSDVTCNENKIDLLIGADVIGNLLTGRWVQLNFDLAAIHTKLAWTVIGKKNWVLLQDDYPVMDSMMTVLSLYVNNASLR
ncbi:hypothetical protein AVEN_184358-1 [Araneus ventricosus]|uniref:Peptidase aspartic putative domain-containing protein n=1 Tax=Araneus ventricosus TaxID=182803 RepID=A0A4Y2IA02_ARAVE|nr:hypothetical protein AVEN_184358-1 [Araneus ventricosus]